MPVEDGDELHRLPLILARRRPPALLKRAQDSAEKRGRKIIGAADGALGAPRPEPGEKKDLIAAEQEVVLASERD